MAAPTLVDPSGQPLRSLRPRVRVAAGYDAAGLDTPELAGWTPGLGSADSEWLPARGAVVARNRDMVRNNGIAAGAEQTLVDNVVGVGFRLAAQPDARLLGLDEEAAEAWAEDVETRFRHFARSSSVDATGHDNLHGLTRLALRSFAHDGEALALPLWFAGRRPGWRLALQLIEADRLCNPPHLIDGKTIRGGIERDRFGRPTAYWIRNSHPADAIWRFAGGEFERVPAETAFGRRRVLHVFDRRFVGQSRGVSMLAAVMKEFRTLDRYKLSELRAAVINAILSLYITTPMESAEVGQLIGNSPEGAAAWMNNIAGSGLTLESAISVLPPGTRPEVVSPARPATAFAQFVESVLRQISAGLNMPYELLNKDFSKTNYSSARAALLEAWRYFLGLRQFLADKWLQPIYELWLEEQVHAGLIDAPRFAERREAWVAARWTGPGRGWVDPVKEAEAAGIRMRTGLTTLQQEVSEQGGDLEEIQRQQAREIRRAAKLGTPNPYAPSGQPFAPAPVAKPEETEP